MARQSKPEMPKPADLTLAQMNAAIPKLERRIEELRGLNPEEIQERYDPIFQAVEDKIEHNLVETFGNNTTEYYRYRVELDTAGWSMGYEKPIHEVRDGYRKGIEQAIGKLETVIAIFKENLGDMGETPSGRASRGFEELNIHPDIKRNVSELFQNGHYSNAIEDACKVLDGLVKVRSGKFDMSGTELMQSVFSAKNPVLKFNDLSSESAKSEQKGMMFLYSGTMLAMRNPRAHGIVEDEPENALELISFISFLCKALDKTTK